MKIGRWLFIIDGIITLPLALAGYVFFPNLPQSGKKTWWTTEEEHILSIKRMDNIGRAGKKPLTKERVKTILLSWHTYLLRELSSTVRLSHPGTILTMTHSIAIHHLEQWLPSTCYGLLAEEFQCRPSSCSRKELHRRADQ